MSVSKMFIVDRVTGDDIKFTEFTITGSTYEPTGQIFHNGQQINCSSGDYEALTELATICSMCNDSSVDYNEVFGPNQTSYVSLFRPSAHTRKSEKLPRLPLSCWPRRWMSTTLANPDCPRVIWATFATVLSSKSGRKSLLWSFRVIASQCLRSVSHLVEALEPKCMAWLVFLNCLIF